MRIILIILMSILFSGCATQINHNDPEAVAANTKIHNSEFSSGAIIGPNFTHNESKLVGMDKFTVNLVKSKGIFGVKVRNIYHRSGWKFLEAISTTKKERIRVVSRDSSVSSCTSIGICLYTEVGLFPINSSYLKTGKSFKFQVNFKRANTVIEIPAGYVTGFLMIAGD